MNADLMHAQIDRQKYETPKKYGNRYQLENSSGRIDLSECAGNCSNRSALASRLEWMNVGYQIWSLSHSISTPEGVCAPPGSLDAPQMIPPTESAAIGLKTIVSPNAELGRGFPRICSECSVCNLKCIAGRVAP
jgi:hypothetical protein